VTVEHVTLSFFLAPLAFAQNRPTALPNLRLKPGTPRSGLSHRSAPQGTERKKTSRRPLWSLWPAVARSYGWADFVCERRANWKSLAKTECNPDNVKPLGMKAYWD